MKLVERLSNSDGISNTTKRCNLKHKIDILEPFRSKFPHYFKLRYELLIQAMKKKDFNCIMEMESVMSSSDQSHLLNHSDI